MIGTCQESLHNEMDCQESLHDKKRCEVPGILVFVPVPGILTRRNEVRAHTTQWMTARFSLANRVDVPHGFAVAPRPTRRQCGEFGKRKLITTTTHEKCFPVSRLHVNVPRREHVVVTWRDLTSAPTKWTIDIQVRGWSPRIRRLWSWSWWSWWSPRMRRPRMPRLWRIAWRFRHHHLSYRRRRW